MWLQFIFENAHFTINVLTALVFFAVFWLYYDAWKGRKTGYLTIKLIGLFFLTISFLVSASQLETTILAVSFMGGAVGSILFEATRIIGYLFLFVSVLMEPLEPLPDKKPSQHAGIGLTLMAPLVIFHPILAVCIALLYLRRGTVGLEDHIKPVSYAFFFLAISEFLSLASLFRDSANITIYNLVAPFGLFWITEHAMQLLSILLMGKWVFSYLLKQFQTQLFMIFTTTILIIFLITTIAFTGLLVKNVQDESLRQLETDVKVLNFSLESKKAELISDSQLLAQTPALITGVTDKAKAPLSLLAEEFLLTKKQSTLLIVGEGGQVLACGEDRERVGDSVSDDPLVKRAFLGETNASVVTRDGVTSPTISLRAATPVKDGAGVIIGVVVAGSSIDSAYVDGLKKATGLDTSIYGDNAISATTFVAPDGKTRAIGMKEEHAHIKKAVLSDGVAFTGSVSILNKDYFASYLPLKDIDNTPVGMLFVGRPQIHVLAAAGRSLEYTFLLTLLLIMLSVIPAYRIARSIAEQI